MEEHARKINKNDEARNVAVAEGHQFYPAVRQHVGSVVGHDALADGAGVPQAKTPKGYFPLNRMATGTSIPSGNSMGGVRQPSISRPK